MENKKNSTIVDFPSLIEAYKTHKWQVALCVVIALALGMVVKYRSQSMCEVKGQVLISDSDSKSSGVSTVTELLGGGTGFGANRSTEDEMVIVVSHSAMLKTVRDLNLNVGYTISKNFLKKIDVPLTSPLALTAAPEIADTISTMLLFKVHVNELGQADIKVKDLKKDLVELSNQPLPAQVKTPYGEFTIAPTVFFKEGKALDENITFNSYSNTALALYDLITVDFSAKKTDIMSLSMITSSPEFGKMIINSVMNNYNEITVEQKRVYNRHMLDFVNERLATLSNELFQSEDHIEEFMNRTDLVDPESQAGIIIGRTNSQEIQLVEAETQYQLLSMAIEFLNNEANNTSMLPVMPSVSGLDVLIEGYNNLILQRLTLQASAKGDNMALKALNQQIDAVKDNLLTALKKQAETAEFEINEARKQFNKTKNRLEEMPALEREYITIKRQQSVKEQLYIYLLRQREEAGMAIASAQPRGVIIDEAYVTDSLLGISTKVLLVLFFILGIIAPGVFWVVKLMISKRISYTFQAVDATGAPLISQLLASEGSTSTAVISPTSQASGRFRLLRGNLLTRALKAGNIVAIVGTTTDDQSSQSYVSLNLAASMSMAGYKTVLLDANIFSGAPHLKADNLVDAIKKGEYKVSTLPIGNGTSIDVYASSSTNVDAPDLIASQGLIKLIEKLSGEYDVVVIETPGVSHFASTEILVNNSNVILNVVTLGKTAKCDAAECGKLLNKDSNQDSNFTVTVE